MQKDRQMKSEHGGSSIMALTAFLGLLASRAPVRARLTVALLKLIPKL